MDISIFEDKSVMPTNEDLKNALGSLYGFWKQLRDYAFEKYPKAVD